MWQLLGYVCEGGAAASGVGLGVARTMWSLSVMG